MSQTLRLRLAVLTAVVLWGISFVATKAALREISPVTLLFARFALGTGLLLGIVTLKGASPVPPRDAWGPLFLMGFIGVFVHQMLQAYGLTLTTAVNTGWLIGLIPIWSALLSAVLLKERFGRWKLVGLLGGLAGALLVMSRGRLDPDVLGLPSTRGDFLILISTMNWAVYSVLGHATIRRLGPTRATAGAMTFGLFLLTPLFVASSGWDGLARLSGAGWGAVVFLGLGCSGLGYLIWFGALERLEVSRVASFLYLEPLVTFAAAVALLHEPIGVTTIIGGLMVLASVALMQRART